MALDEYSSFLYFISGGHLVVMFSFFVTKLIGQCDPSSLHEHCLSCVVSNTVNFFVAAGFTKFADLTGLSVG